MSRVFYVHITVAEEDFNKPYPIFQQDINNLVDECVMDMKEYIRAAYVEENLATGVREGEYE